MKWTRNTPYKVAMRYLQRRDCALNEREIMFGLMVFCGIPRGHAWGICFPDSRASDVSVPQLCSRLIGSWAMHNFFSYMEECEKGLQFRYDSEIECRKHCW